MRLKIEEFEKRKIRKVKVKDYRNINIERYAASRKKEKNEVSVKEINSMFEW